MVQGTRESQARVRERKPDLVHRSVRGKYGALFLFCGVILPLTAISFELTTHFCAQHFFDPFPSASHVILFLLIPLSNYMAWLSGRRDMSAHYGFMALISGMAMGIGCLYALMFLPLTPHSAMYTLMFGFGLLGFAPLLSIPCSWLGGKNVCRLASSRKTFFDPHQVEHIGHLIVLCLVVAVELPSTLTRMNLSLAAEPATEKQGVGWLRQFGSEEVMLRACYERSGRATDILGSLYESGHPMSIETARSLFYKVTGKPFNSVPIPSAARATIQHAGLVDDPNGLNADVKDEFDLDSDIAGENVSGVARGLSVSASSVVGSVEPNSGVADLDWSATFSNSSPYDREARAKLRLPHGGVVTKATVTVNGVEHDATILVRSLARMIYKQSVIEHKDPLLVSTCGEDQILIQCFPVEPNSSMVVHLKIAAPLVLSASKTSGALMLPAFEERNFQFEQPVRVDLKSESNIEAPVPKLIAPNLVTADAEKTSNSGHRVVFDVEPTQIARFGGVVNFSRDAKVVTTIITKGSNYRPGDTCMAARAIVPTYKTPKKLTVLIDGSAPMQRYIPDLANALKALPPAVKADIVVVGDEVQTLGDNSNATAYATTLAHLQKYHAQGGHADGAELLTRISSSPVLWIHGAQPLNSADAKIFNELINRPTDTPWLYDVQTVSGPNEFLNGFEANANFVSVPRVGKIEDDLSRLFGSWTASDVKPADNLKFVDWTRPDGDASAPSGSEVEKNAESIPGFEQLYGYQKLLQSYQSADKTPALVLAEKYHLVSPISSAVVIQYVPSLHPSPTAKKAPPNLAYKDSVNSKSELTDQKQDFNFSNPFDAVKTQLNSLSTAAGSAPDGFATKSASMEPQFEVSRNSQAVEEKLPSVAPVGGGAKGLENPDASSDQAIESLKTPSLQGSTNGTIGSIAPQEKFEDGKELKGKTLRMEAVPGTNNNQWTGIQPQMQVEQCEGEPASKRGWDIASAFSIFFLVFASMFAFFKLLKALSHSKS